METKDREAVVRLGEADRRRIREWTEAGYPVEACGLLIGKRVGDEVWIRSVREAANLESDRAATRYELDPQAFLAADREARRMGLDVVGFWHSHPDAPPVPSETDLAAAWPGYVYMIVSVEAGTAKEIRVWSLTDGSFQQGVLK
ncbi:MAG: Mov34/MPN/PAD-1 family protein [Gemmatimonadota bacterium]